MYNGNSQTTEILNKVSKVNPYSPKMQSLKKKIYKIQFYELI